MTLGLIYAVGNAYTLVEVTNLKYTTKVKNSKTCFKKLFY